MRELAPELYCIRLSGNAHCVFYGLLRILERISYSAADIVITVSHAMKKYIMKIYDEKKTIIPVYPYPPIPEEVYDKTCETSHSPKRSITAIYGGSMLDRIYDIDLLLHSLRDLYPVVKGRFKIMILGKGDAKIIHAIKQAKREMPEIIDVLELLPRKKFYELLRKSDLCIVPLVLNQLTSIAIPNKLIDCILLEKPVITAALPSTIELTYKFNGILLYKPGSLYSLERTLLYIVENESTLKTISSVLENQHIVFSEAWNKYFYPVVKAIHGLMES
jgi:glycosyltransferase involved in cell wall biosynthesis